MEKKLKTKTIVSDDTWRENAHVGPEPRSAFCIPAAVFT